MSKLITLICFVATMNCIGVNGYLVRTNGTTAIATSAWVFGTGEGFYCLTNGVTSIVAAGTNLYTQTNGLTSLGGSSYTIQADSFWSFDSGTVGTKVDTNMAVAQTRNAIGVWTAALYPMTNFWLSNNFAPEWPVSVNINGTVYANTPTRTWVTGLTNNNDYLIYSLGVHADYCLVGGFVNFLFDHTQGGTVGYNPLVIVGDSGNSISPNVSDYSALSNGVVCETTGLFTSPHQIIEPTNHWVWWTVVYTNRGFGGVQLWEPTNHTQIGLTTHNETNSRPVGQVTDILFGRQDQHIIFPTNAWIAYSGLVIVTNPAKASFPLLPWSVTLDRTAGIVNITNPAVNGNIVTGQSQTISGSSIDYGNNSVTSGVAYVSVSLDSTNWYTATGTTNWSYTTNGFIVGTNTVYVKMEDNMANESVITNRVVRVDASITLKDSVTGTTDGSAHWDTTIYLASKFVAGSSYTCSQVDFPLFRSGLPANNINAYIYSDTSDHPNAVLTGGTSSDTLTGNSFGTSEPSSSLPTFTGMTASLVNGTTYWLVLKASSVNNGAYVLWPYVNSFLAGNNMMCSSDGTSWSGCTSQFRRLKFDTYQ